MLNILPNNENRYISSPYGGKSNSIPSLKQMREIKHNFPIVWSQQNHPKHPQKQANRKYFRITGFNPVPSIQNGPIIITERV